MTKNWFAWGFVAAAVAVVFIGFNYQGGKDAVPLSEIFPDEETFPTDVEYEFVQDETSAGTVITEDSKQTGADKAAPEKPESARELVFAPIQSKAEDQPVVAGNIRSGVTDETAQKSFNFTVQIASFRTLKKAEEALVKIRAKIPHAYISKHDLGEKGIWYRIYAGQFDRRAQAEVSLNAIKRDFNSSFIISPFK